MKRLLSLLIAVALCLTASVTAFADQTTDEYVQPYYTACTPDAEGPHGPHILIKEQTLKHPETGRPYLKLDTYKCQWCGDYVYVTTPL